MTTTKREVNWVTFGRIGTIFLFSLMVISCVGCGGGGGGASISTYIKGTVTDANSADPIEGAQIKTDAGYSAFSLPDGTYLMSHPAGTFAVTTEASGYNQVSCSGVVVPEGGTLTQDFELTPFYSEPPNKPVLSSPTDGEIDVSLRPQLQTEAFSDPDSDDTHAQTEWQIIISEYVILDVTTDSFLTSFVPELILNAETEYHWRVRFYDNHLDGSDWSDVYSFTTTIDYDNDGMPDAWEEQYDGLDPLVEDASEDLDGDEISNLDEFLLGTDPTEPNPISGSITGWICGRVMDANSEEPIEGARIVTSGRVSAISFPNGAYEMLHPSGTYTLAASATGYYSIKRAGVEVLEGGIEEQDIKLTSILRPLPPPSGGGGGGCFIATAAYGTAMERHVKVLCNFRDRFMINTYLGKAFMVLYNTYSPPVADFIANHNTARLIVLWSLMPVVGMSWMALNIGLIPTLTVILLMLIFINISIVVLFKP